MAWHELAEYKKACGIQLTACRIILGAMAISKDEMFNQNLLRLLCAGNFFLASMTASREMYGKSYFSLGVVEKQNVDQMVLNSIGGNFQALTPAWFGEPKQGQTGFQNPGNQPESS